jgi:hypothetical protein
MSYVVAGKGKTTTARRRAANAPRYHKHQSVFMVRDDDPVSLFTIKASQKTADTWLYQLFDHAGEIYGGGEWISQEFLLDDDESD